MGNKALFLLTFFWIAALYSCNSGSQKVVTKDNPADNKILQREDGTISLQLEEADCYHDKSNPSSNTAEWNVVVSKSGRFYVWLSSATKDTTNLEYNYPVMLSILDNRLEARPSIDRIIRNSNDVALPYFRADSFVGALYIQDTGLYNIQLISEKIVPYSDKGINESSSVENGKLLSVFLTPVSR